MKLRFGEFLLDTHNRLLLRAQTEVRVEPLVFECIAYLANRAGMLVRTDELRSRLWPSVHVADSAPRRVINAARRALGDRGGAQGLIRTRKRLGYVFMCSVTVESDGAAGHDPLGAWPFVGRAQELEQLGRWLDRAGVGGLCLLGAEAGAGKSSLLGRLQGQAAARGVWLSGQCHPEPEQPAFWPFREIARQLLAQRDLYPHVLRLLKSAESVSAAIPELARAARGPGHESQSAHARFESYEAWARMLEALSSVTPLRIVLEDMHWADDGSVWMLAALARVARRSALHVFVSYRSEALSQARAFSELLARVSGREGVLQVTLDGLSQQALEALLTAVEFPDASPRLAAELLRLSGGNALFVRELVRHACATSGAFGASLPASFSHIVAERVRCLPERCRDLLELGAVLGGEFEPELLRAVSGAGTLHELLSQLEPALGAGLVRTVAGVPDQFVFSHSLIREALVAGLPAQRRQAHHIAVLAALRAQPSAANLVALASHAFEAGSAVPVEERRELCERAGRQAFERLEYQRAAQQLGRAVELLPADDASVQAAALVLAWAKACWHADRPEQEVGSALLAAAERARRASQPPLLAEAAIMYAVGDESIMDSRIVLLRPDARALAEEAWQALLSAAAGDVERLPRDLAHRLACVLCWFRIESYDLPTRQRLSELALGLAPSEPSPVRRAWLLGLRAAARPAQAQEALSALAAHLHEPGRNPRERIEGWIMLLALYLSHAQLARYEAAVREISELVQPLADSVTVGRLGERLSTYLSVPLCAPITACVIRGQLAEALQRLAALRAVAARQGLARSRRGDINAFMLGRWLAAYLGRSAELEASVDEQLRASPGSRFLGVLWKLHFALQRGALDVARQHYAELRDSDFQPVTRGYVQPARVVTLAEIGDACTHVGSAADAAVLYERLSPHAELSLIDGVVISWGSCSRVLGALATQLARYVEAEQHLARALAVNGRLGHRPELVRTRLALARLYRRSGREHEADPVLALARADAAAMGMAGFAHEL